MNYKHQRSSTVDDVTAKFSARQSVVSRLKQQYNNKRLFQQCLLKLIEVVYSYSKKWRLKTNDTGSYCGIYLEVKREHHLSTVAK